MGRRRRGGGDPHRRPGSRDLVLLDISLPKRSGLEVLEELRAADNHVPVIVLSARQDEFDKVAALQLGADDYVTKPFALAELLARVAARAAAGAHRRATTGRERPPAPARRRGRALRFGDVAIDLGARTVSRGGLPVKLTHLELELLVFFIRNPHRVFSRDELVARSGACARPARPARSTTSWPSCAPSWRPTPTARSTSSPCVARATASFPDSPKGETEDKAAPSRVKLSAPPPIRGQFFSERFLEALLT